MSGLFHPPVEPSTADRSPQHSQSSKPELGPMSDKLARICRENGLGGTEDCKKQSLLSDFDKTQGPRLSGGILDPVTQPLVLSDQTSYQSLINQLVDKVTKDMFNEENEEQRSDEALRMTPEQSALGQNSGNGEKGSGSAFKGESDSIEILRKLKNKVLKNSPAATVPSSDACAPDHPASNSRTPASPGPRQRGVLREAPPRGRRSGKSAVNASSLMCSSFHAAQERERRKHMMVMISLVCCPGSGLESRRICFCRWRPELLL